MTANAPRSITNLSPWRFGAVMMCFAAFILVLLSQPAEAVNNSANTLKVSPVRTDIEVQAGTSKVVQVTVSNLTDAPLTVDPVVNDFISGDERGAPALILDENEFAPTHSLKRFASPLSEVIIPARETKTVNVVVAVPPATQAGGYFGAVRFTPTSSDNGGQVNVNASVASLILLKVPGDIVEKMELTQFAVQQNGVASSYFTSANDLYASFRLENKGGAQLGPFGKLSVQKGDELISEADFNTTDRRDLVLPDSARRWESPLGDIGNFGYYTVSATFTYGDENQTIEASESFWVIPKVAIVAAIIGFLGLLGAGTWLVFFVRSRRQRSALRRRRLRL